MNSALKNFFWALISNRLSLVGAATTTGTALLFTAFLIAEAAGIFHAGPYTGLISFVLLPTIFILGLLLIPLGLVLNRRQRRKSSSLPSSVPLIPILDFSRERIREFTLVFLVMTMINVGILLTAAYKTVEIADSTQFCGTTCHVMKPEFSAYQRSPHAHVACVECHVGSGAKNFVQAKMAGTRQLIGILTGNYSKPIPAPVHNLRPARETCEHCHWPEKFVGERIKVYTHFSDDEANTEKKTVLLMHIGGGERGKATGIHWHVDPENEVRYRSDPKRGTIYQVKARRNDGSWLEYFPDGEQTDKLPADAGEWRTMDCIDCHNRPTHIFRSPKQSIERALAEGRIDKTLPFIRREGMRLLKLPVKDLSEAQQTIATELRNFYSSQFPQVLANQGPAIESAAKELATLLEQNVFPAMNLQWNTHADHIGHDEFPGCFRCHDGNMKTAQGKSISDDCETCHKTLAEEEKDPEILKQLQP